MFFDYGATNSQPKTQTILFARFEGREQICLDFFADSGAIVLDTNFYSSSNSLRRTHDFRICLFRYGLCSIFGQIQKYLFYLSPVR